MRVFITGATGFVGRAIGDRLRQEGHALTILARNPQAPRTRASIQRWQARTLVGDAMQDGPWITQLEGVDAAVHVVGIVSQCGQATFENVHTHGTRRLVSALANHGIKRLIHISALGTRPNAVSRYHQTKWQAEEIVRQSGLDHTILRPSIIYGPEDRFVNLFAKISRFSPLLPVIGPGLGKLQPISVEAVALSVAAALRQPASIGKTFDLCGPEALSFNELLDEILQVLGRNRRKFHLPLGIARTLAAFYEWFFPAVFHQAPPLNRDQIIMLQEDNAGDPKPARDLFGLPECAFREGISRYLNGVSPGKQENRLSRFTDTTTNS